MNDRFDLDKRSENCRCFRYTTSSMKMIQIIHRHIMANMKFIFFCPLCNFFYRLAFRLFLQRFV